MWRFLQKPNCNGCTRSSCYFNVFMLCCWWLGTKRSQMNQWILGFCVICVALFLFSPQLWIALNGSGMIFMEFEKQRYHSWLPNCFRHFRHRWCWDWDWARARFIRREQCFKVLLRSFGHQFNFVLIRSVRLNYCFMRIRIIFYCELTSCLWKKSSYFVITTNWP